MNGTWFRLDIELEDEEIYCHVGGNCGIWQLAAKDSSLSVYVNKTEYWLELPLEKEKIQRNEDRWTASQHKCRRDWRNVCGSA